MALLISLWLGVGGTQIVPLRPGAEFDHMVHLNADVPCDRCHEALREGGPMVATMPDPVVCAPCHGQKDPGMAPWPASHRENRREEHRSLEGLHESDCAVCHRRSPECVVCHHDSSRDLGLVFAERWIRGDDHAGYASAVQECALCHGPPSRVCTNCHG